MRLIFDAQSARRNHRFIVVLRNLASSFPEQKRPRCRGRSHKKSVRQYRLTFDLHYLAGNTLPLTPAKVKAAMPIKGVISFI
jgi:hypothetical protein